VRAILYTKTVSFFCKKQSFTLENLSCAQPYGRAKETISTQIDSSDMAKWDDGLCTAAAMLSGVLVVIPSGVPLALLPWHSCPACRSP
jgi:hypothetical protein